MSKQYIVIEKFNIRSIVSFTIYITRLAILQ